MDLNEINKASSTFWSFGNYPTQKVNNLTFYNVLYHLKLQYLLSDKILSSSSFYFESEITRNVTERLRKLFEEGEILYFIDEDMEDFEEHGTAKVKKSPKDLLAYQDKEKVKLRAKKLNALSPPLRRPPSSISDKIVDLWIKEINSTEQETLGYKINQSIKEPSRQIEIKVKLSKFAIERNKDFVWEYLQPQLDKLKLNKDFQRTARKTLSQLYSMATSEILGVSLDNGNSSLKNYLKEDSKFNTSLFDECMRILGLKEAINSVNVTELIALKSAYDFTMFKEFYFSLIESCSYKAEATKKVLPLFINTEQALISGKINLDNFLHSFDSFSKSLNIPRKNYKKPLEMLMSRYQAFNKATITSFIALVQENTDKQKRIIKKELTALNNATDFALANENIIERIIVDNWKIPKTAAPGGFSKIFTKVIGWLENFRKSEYEYALLVMQNIQYYSETDIDGLLEIMSGEIRKLFSDNFDHTVFFSLGNYGSSSGGQFLYKLKQKLRLTDINFPKNYFKLDSNIKAIVFVDDLIGSGKQALDFFNNNLSNLNVDRYYYSLVGFEKGVENIKDASAFTNVFTTKKLYESDRAFSEHSEIFPDSQIRTTLKEISQRYGEKLYPKGPLGYDNSEALIVFSHNTPNNTLPIIWASANNEKEIGIPWNPLWERLKAN